MVLLITFTAGVIIGFLISLMQMISLKGETLTLKSKNKKVQIELDALRNQGIDDIFAQTTLPKSICNSESYDSFAARRIELQNI